MHKFDATKCNSNQWWNNDKCQYECKKHNVSEKDYVWNPSTCNCENDEYLASIMDDSTIICDEVIKPYDEEINFNEKKATYKKQNLYILLVFLLITIALLITAICYCFLIKYWGKHLLPFYNTNNGLNKFYIDSINSKWVI